MAKMKYKWVVSPVPTGRYRSFQLRAWPTASYADGSFAANIICDDDYRPHLVRDGKHAPLKLRIRDCSSGGEWKIMITKTEYATLKEAKEALAIIFEHNPQLQKDIPDAPVS